MVSESTVDEIEEYAEGAPQTPSFSPSTSARALLQQTHNNDDADRIDNDQFSTDCHEKDGGNAALPLSTSSSSSKDATVVQAGAATPIPSLTARIAGKRRISLSPKQYSSTRKHRRTTHSITGIPAHGVARGTPPATSWTGPTPPPATLWAGNIQSQNETTTNDHDGSDQRPADGTPTRREASRPLDPGGNPHNISK